MTKLVLLHFLLFVIPLFAFAEKTEFAEINIAGIENPTSICISEDGLTMVIIDQPKKGFMKMMQSNRPYIESGWSAAMPITEINKRITETIKVDAPFLSYDNKRLYFCANFENGYGGYDIYFCKRTSTGWSDPINSGKPINSEKNECNPSLSGNNRILLFTRMVHMKKIELFNTGEFWLSKLNKQSTTWELPEKLNTAINSKGISYPKISDDNHTIIYSRVADEKDKWDIYWVKKWGREHWYLPVRIDTLATKDSEISPVYCKQDEMLYYIVNTSDDKKPKGQIYAYPLEKSFKPEPTIHISGKVSNPIKKQAVCANIIVTDPVMGEVLFYQKAEKDGTYNALVNSNTEYMFHVYCENYSHSYQHVNKKETTQAMELNFQLSPITTLNLNIYDVEELRLLDADLAITNNNGDNLNLPVTTIRNGLKSIELPIGINYIIRAKAKDYFENQLELDLSTIVMYNEFEHDIELQAHKRKLQLNITNIEDGNPIFANIDITENRRKLKIPCNAIFGQIGNYETTLKEGESFGIDIRGPRGYAFMHQEIDLNKQRELSELNIQLKPLKRKVPIRLSNINFEFNSSDLLETSYSELSRVAQLINDNPDIKIEIMAHSDDIGSDEFNQILSDKRANSVMDYLIEIGIEPIRLIANGYGETSPIVPNNTEKNRALNRRVEMKILDLNDNETILEEEVDFE